MALFVQILDSVPPPKFQDAIRSRIEDLAQWEETLWFWRRKNYRVTNINGLLDNYDRHVSTKQRAYVGNGSPASAIAAPAAKEEEDPLEQLKELTREIECWCERENREPFEWEQELIDRAKAADRQPRPF